MENDIVTLINSVGFPIAVSIALYWQNIKSNETISELKEVIINNTKTLENLVVNMNNKKE